MSNCGGLMRIAWLLLLGLAACSPYSFPREVGAFSTGVDQLSSGFADGFAALAADRKAKIELDLTRSRARVAIASTCLVGPSPNAPPCELFAVGGQAPPLPDIEKQRGKTMAAIGALKNYADALAAVTNSADRAAYDAAAAQLAGSVGALAANAETVAPGASTVAPAAVNLAAWLVGAALDQQRFASLKAAVTAVGTAPPGGASPISIVAKSLGAGLFALSQARQEFLIAEAQILQSQLQPSLSDGAYRQGLSDTQAVIAVLAGLQQADPMAAGTTLVSAHDALLAAIQDPGRNYPALMIAVGEFATRAAAVQAALAATAGTGKAAAR